MLVEKVRNTILNNDLIKRGTQIVIGLSGGPDSVCLFHVLYQLQAEFALQLYAVHINHGLRADAALEDQRYVEKLCAEYQVPCQTFLFAVDDLAKAWNMTSEEAGRKVRYESFYEVARKIARSSAAIDCEEKITNSRPLVKIAVAQNLNDQAETVLLRLLRGTGTDGLAGIAYERDGLGGIPIIRPLLDISRQEIEAYCQEKKLTPCIDQTNLKPIYTRNKIRLSLLPYLAEEFNPNIINALNRLSFIAQEDKDYFFTEAEKIIAPYRQPKKDATEENFMQSFEIPIFVLQNLHSAVLKRVIMIILKEIGLNKDLSASHLASAVQIIRKGKTSSTTDFPGGYRLKIAYKNAEFLKFDQEEILENSRIDQEHILTASILHQESAIRSDGEGKNKMKVLFDHEAIKNTGCEPILRYRKSGDWIRPQGMKGTKKLQDFFVDAKIRREQRDCIPLVCLGSEVIWIIGYRVSENYRVKDTTENILVLEYCEKL